MSVAVVLKRLETSRVLQAKLLTHNYSFFFFYSRMTLTTNVQSFICKNHTWTFACRSSAWKTDYSSCVCAVDYPYLHIDLFTFLICHYDFSIFSIPLSSYCSILLVGVSSVLLIESLIEVMNGTRPIQISMEPHLV